VTSSLEMAYIDGRPASSAEDHLFQPSTCHNACSNAL
jgi:hypothetical protein